MSEKSLVVGELSLPACLRDSSPNETFRTEFRFWNCLTKISPLQPVTAMRCGDPRWKDHKMFEFLEMFRFRHICGGISFWSNFGRPKIWVFPCGSPHLMAVTGHSWLTLVGNSNNEVCSPSNNTVSKAFWQKKVLPEQRISYCEGIYLKVIHSRH